MKYLRGLTLSTLACEIVDYLANCPSVSDSLEGIARWRLPLFRLEREIVRVKEGLEELIAVGVVQKTVRADGREYYRLNPDKLEDVRAFAQARTSCSETSSTHNHRKIGG